MPHRLYPLTRAFRVGAVILALVECAASCEGSPFRPDRLTGCYAERKNGTAEIRITKSAQEYTAHLLVNGVWDSMTVRRVTTSELGPLFGKDTAKIAEGLAAVNGPFGVFRLRPGAPGSGKDPGTDYIVFFLLGTTPGFKVPCP